MHRNYLSLAAVAVLLSACSTKDNNPPADTAAMAPAPAAVPAAPAVTDPQIAAIVVAANDADIAGGKQAQSKGAHADVKAFGKMMSTDHGSVNKAAVDLVTKLNVTPEENDVSRMYADNGKATRDSLSKMKGAAFDKAYMDSEVTYHVGLLDAIDKTLIPSAQNAELKALLEQTRPTVAAHLKAAQDIQAKLNK